MAALAASTSTASAASGIRSQLTFSGTSACSCFEPHFLKPNKCTACMSDITCHTSEAVTSDEHVRQALEYGAKASKTPSTVIPNRPATDEVGVAAVADTEDASKRELYVGADGMGALYLGGYAAVMQKTVADTSPFVVNTAKGLDMFGPKYLEGKRRAREGGVTFLEMEWVDDMNQELSVEDLTRAVQFIHAARSRESEGEGAGGTLVHCAQGKSRSTSVVLAYVLARAHLRIRTQGQANRPGGSVAGEAAGEPERGPGVSLSDALAYIQECRAMAAPNRHFVVQLEAHARSGAFEHMLASEATAEEAVAEGVGT